MEDFIMRTVIETDGRFSVSRTRNSNGKEFITISLDDRNVLYLDTLNQAYEIRTLATLLNKIADNPCKLPEVKE